ncbi:MAG: ribonuclease HII [Candidatus Saccharimonadales bacterium]
MIVGIDEVGRGCLAGPICVAAVAWRDSASRKGLADSKVLNAEKRVYMAAKIRELAAGIGIGWASAREIDTLGVTAALKLAAERALAQIPQELITAVIIDGHLKLVEDSRAVAVIKADSNVPAVMAASIVAKVARDTYMQAQDIHFNGYQFAKHVGYGTAVHRAAITQLGPCELHRMSYAPLKEFA